MYVEKQGKEVNWKDNGKMFPSCPMLKCKGLFSLLKCQYDMSKTQIVTILSLQLMYFSQTLGDMKGDAIRIKFFCIQRLHSSTLMLQQLFWALPSYFNLHRFITSGQNYMDMVIHIRYSFKFCFGGEMDFILHFCFIQSGGH